MLDVVIPVHNGEGTIGDTLKSLLRQDGHGHHWKRIFVVDDGSTDRTCGVVQAIRDPRVQLLHMPTPQGRGNACSHGIRAGRAGGVLIVDADCMATDESLLRIHDQVCDAGYDVSFGRIEAQGDGFWQRRAQRIAGVRARRFRSGDPLAMTTCNVAIRRALLEKAGGFARQYRHYGFEDRDLLATLQGVGARFHYEARARVYHQVDESVAVLCKKQEISGRYTAPILRQRHPGFYARLPYAKVDLNTAPGWVRLLAPLAITLRIPVLELAERLVASAWAGEGSKEVLVRFATALAFLHGTAQQRKDQRPGP